MKVRKNSYVTHLKNLGSSLGVGGGKYKMPPDMCAKASCRKFLRTEQNYKSVIECLNSNLLHKSMVARQTTLSILEASYIIKYKYVCFGS